MSTEDKRSAETIEDAARALGEIKTDENFDISQANELQTKITSPSRIALAKATLENNNIITQLGEKFNVSAFSFDNQLKPIEEEEIDTNNPDSNQEKSRPFAPRVSGKIRRKNEHFRVSLLQKFDVIDD